MGMTRLRPPGYAGREEEKSDILTILFVYIFGDDPPSPLGYGGREDALYLPPRFSLFFTTGDDRLRQRDSRGRSLLLGMATVPVTHLLHTILANRLSEGMTAMADAASRAFARLQPVAVAA